MKKSTMLVLVMAFTTTAIWADSTECIAKVKAEEKAALDECQKIKVKTKADSQAKKTCSADAKSKFSPQVRACMDKAKHEK